MTTESKRSILIVGRVPEIIVQLHNELRSAYHVFSAGSGHSELDMAGMKRIPDLILLDAMPTHTDSRAVLSALRENPDTRDIPVIFLSATAGDEEIWMESGCSDCINKPIKPVVLLARIECQLQARLARDWLKEPDITIEAEIARRMAENELCQNVCIQALARLAESRDPASGRHIVRTQAYILRMATGLRQHPRFSAFLTPSNIALLVKAAPLHDIGKLGIPDSILQKPGPLSAAEWKIMKSHAKLGAEAIEHAEQDIQNSPPFLQMAKEIAHWHHEKWDGSGYPDGLAGDDIPIAARLMAVADVFDALISARIYKTAIPYGKARYIMASGRGKHFDPDVVDMFLTGFEDFVAIAEKHRDEGFLPEEEHPEPVKLHANAEEMQANS